MIFTNRAVEEVIAEPKGLTTKQKGFILTDLQEGKSISEIHMSRFIDTNLIKGAKAKLEKIQSVCSEIMFGKVDENEKAIPTPKTKAELISKAKEVFEDCDDGVFATGEDEIVKATGTWAQYKETFKQD